MPALPKPAGARRRTNRKAGARLLSSVPPPDLEHVPEDHRQLPAGSWETGTRAWWAEVVRCPMAGEWTELDWHGLQRLALLVDTVAVGFGVVVSMEPLPEDASQADRRAADDRRLAAGKLALAAMAEIRQQGALYGLTPVDRARLHWELEKGEKAKTARAQRERPAAVRADPRAPAPARRARARG